MNTCVDCDHDEPIISLVCDAHWDERYERDGNRALLVLIRDYKMRRPSFDVDGSIEKAERERIAAEHKAMQAAKKPTKKVQKMTRPKYTSWEESA